MLYNQTKPVYCYKYDNGTVTLVGIVDDFESFIYERQFAGIGEWQLTINGDSNSVKYLKEANIIWSSKKCCGLISEFDEDRTENDYTITVRGVELKGLLQKRVIIPPSGKEFYSLKEAPEYVIAHIIRDQLQNPTNASRQISLDYSYDDEIRSTSITYQTRYANAAEEISTIAATYGIGWYATIEDGRIAFHIYHGVDRKASQSINNRLLISFENDNVDTVQQETSLHPTNYAYVGGKGEGASQVIQSVTKGASGWDRTEVFVDASSAGTTAELTEAGNEELASYGDVNVFNLAPSESLRRTYQKEYDLGDQGTILKQGTKIDFLLASITEIYENNQWQLQFQLGYDEKTLAKQLMRIEQQSFNVAATNYKGGYVATDRLELHESTSGGVMLTGQAFGQYIYFFIPVAKDLSNVTKVNVINLVMSVRSNSQYVGAGDYSSSFKEYKTYNFQSINAQAKPVLGGISVLLTGKNNYTVGTTTTAVNGTATLRIRDLVLEFN